MKWVVWSAVAALGVTAGAARCDEARAVVDKALAAHGGADKIALIRGLAQDSRGVFHFPSGPVACSRDGVAQLPDRMRWNLTLSAGAQKVTLLLACADGRGWRSTNGQVRDLPGMELDDVREYGFVQWLITLVPLADRSAPLQSLPDGDLDGKPAAGVKLSLPGRPEASLYFDKDSGRLAKIAFRGKDAGLEVNKEVLLGDYKLFGAVQMPAKVVEQSNGRKTAEWTVSEYRFVEGVGADLLRKP